MPRVKPANQSNWQAGAQHEARFCCVDACPHRQLQGKHCSFCHSPMVANAGEFRNRQLSVIVADRTLWAQAAECFNRRE
ncbi:MAG TPA: hypothetical protein DCR55_09075 [Lentisphaeria bacterium]|nr:hypothetical protein [Lentisphaeria bacterium]